jgi:TolA-binding protein
MLKLGYSQAELGRAAEAEATLKELVRSYPQSTAAGLARKRLQRLGDG